MAKVQPQVYCHLLVQYKIAFCTHAFYTVVNSAGWLHIIDFMTEAAGQWKFEHGPQLAPGLDFGYAWVKGCDVGC